MNVIRMYEIKFWLKARIGQNLKLHLMALFLIGAEMTIIIHNYITSARPVIRRWGYLVSDMSCHYAEHGDALPAAEDPSFSPKPNSIFFHETSCRGGLTSRQACSVESAARLHPNRQIYVLFSAPVNDHVLNKSCLKKLLQYHNVHFARVHILEYTRGTVIEPIIADLDESTYPMEHASDILRILTLNKWGGVYLDTDMIVAKSLNPLPTNWIAKHSDETATSGILSFGKDVVGSNLTSAILKEIFETYDPYQWSVKGIKAIQEVIKRRCPHIMISNHCYGLKIFPYELFYPLHYTLWKLYFKVGVITNIEPPYTYHMWNFLSSFEQIKENTPYATLARKYCPQIFEMYNDEFGI